MREPNLGITMPCAICGKSFWCEDGLPVCSSACDYEHIRRIEKEDKEQRQFKVTFCIESNEDFGAYAEDTNFDEMDDDDLNKCFEFLDYLCDK